MHRQINKILWVSNVCWLGGTALWALESIKALSKDWYHKILFLHSNPNEEVLELFNQAGIEVTFADNITKDIVEKYDPSVVILSNTQPNMIEGAHPWNWLTGRQMTIYVHHSAVRPWLPGAHIDVFVSEYLKAKYKHLLSRMKEHLLIYMGVDINTFTPIQPRYDFPIIGRLTNDNPDKFPKNLPNILSKVNAVKEIVGAQKYYPDYNFGKLNFGDYKPFRFMSRWSMYFYYTGIPETYGRTLVEAMAVGLPVVAHNIGASSEIIDNGINGFLFDDDEEAIYLLNELSEDANLRASIGAAAKEKIIAEHSTNCFAKFVEPKMKSYLLRR